MTQAIQRLTWNQKVMLASCMLVKLLFLMFFSSGYVLDRFTPFLSYWVETFSNPWSFFYQLNQVNIFPFPPLMLYFQSLFYGVAQILQLGNSFGERLLYSLPTLIADLALFKVILYLFPLRFNEVFFFYFCSPIVIFSAYMQGQYDIIPTALLTISIIFLIERKLFWAALLYGFALSTKGHTLIVLPIMALFLIHNKVPLKEVVFFLVIPFVTYFSLSVPFIFTESYQNMVLWVPKQFLIFDLTLTIGNTEVYPVIFVLLLIFARFSLYKKVNQDLLFCYVAILYAVFILLISPAPGWYIWMLPFLSIFFIKFTVKEKRMYLLYLALSASYLVYFLFFDQSPYQTLLFEGEELAIKFNSPFARNFAFTILEALLLTAIYACYKYGVCSNYVYSNPSSPVIGIGGDSGSGKTTLLNDVKGLLSRDKFTVIRELETDGYHKWERGHDSWSDFTHLDPKANHLHNLAEQVHELKSGKTIMKREYLHSTGKFSKPKPLESGDYIVVCGLHPFYLPKMRKAIDLKIYINTQDILRKHWKIRRDTAERGYSTEQILKQIESRQADSQKYIQPQKSFANLVVRYFTEDEFTPGDDFSPKIKLKITVDASLQLDGLVSLLRKMGNTLDWDYSDDLVNQYIVFEHPIESEHLQQALKEYVPNAEDLVGFAPEWAGNYRGIVQLIILMVLSEILERN